MKNELFITLAILNTVVIGCSAYSIHLLSGTDPILKMAILTHNVDDAL